VIVIVNRDRDPVFYRKTVPTTLLSTWPKVFQHCSRRVCNPAALNGGLQTRL